MGIDFTGSNLVSVLLLFTAGLVLIIKGGDLFVDAATWIAEASGIPKFIIGATVVSFATTLPEMLVSVFAALEGNADIAVGNAVGSVTANTGLIMCLSLVCMNCAMTRKQFGVKAGILLATIVVLFGFTRDGQLSVFESAVILVFFAIFLAENLIAGRREQENEASESDARAKIDAKTTAINIAKFVFGAAAIVLGAQLLIDNGSALARMLNVPDSIIAATMIAIGTSLPELVTTITAIRKKQSSLSVGNIIGANIMDLTLIMPLCALIQGKSMIVERQGMLLDIPACLVISAAALIPALISGKFKRWIGYLIGGLYIVYLIIMFTSFGV
ncbi:MAG: calcium/sodium antiporter [Merdibacter sp.]